MSKRKPGPVTDTQQQVYEYLREFHREWGIMPTIREIQEHFGWESPQAVMSHLRPLERKGKIRRYPKTSRGIVILIDE